MSLNHKENKENNNNKPDQFSQLRSRHRKGLRLINNLFAKMTFDYGEFPDDNMMMDELLKITDPEFDALIADPRDKEILK